MIRQFTNNIASKAAARRVLKNQLLPELARCQTEAARTQNDRHVADVRVLEITINDWKRLWNLG